MNKYKIKLIELLKTVNINGVSLSDIPNSWLNQKIESKIDFLNRDEKSYNFVYGLVEAPKDLKNGDFSFPCFFFAMKGVDLVKNPNEAANIIYSQILNNNIFDVSVAGPFLNFKIKESILIDEFSNYKENLDLLKNIGNNKKILIEYSSPNTNKSQHLGHLRNNLLGVSLSNIFRDCGFNVVTSCIFNDKGTAMAKTIWGYMKFGNNSEPNDIKSDKFVSEFYVKASQYEKEHPEVTEEINEINRKWENGDVKVVAMWKKLVDWVYEGYKETYEKLGCTFDYKYYESDIYKKGKEISQEAFKNGILKEGDSGAIVTNLEKYDLPDTIVIKSDGTSLYITQDIYLAKLRNEEICPDKTIYIVANEQNLHFKQLFALLDQLHIGKRENYFHLNYGYVTLPTGRMKSREGTVVDADDLIDSVVKEAQLIAPGQKNVAEEIGLGAVKFQFLKVDAFSDFVFDPIKSIELTGDTSVYIQYAYARINSIFNKLNIDSLKFNNLKFKNIKLENEEINLMREILTFNDSMEKVIETYSPSFLCKKLLDIANAYNSFYQKCRILDLENDDLKNFRLELSRITSVYIKYGLNLLGINIVDKM